MASEEQNLTRPPDPILAWVRAMLTAGRITINDARRMIGEREIPPLDDLVTMVTPEERP